MNLNILSEDDRGLLNKSLGNEQYDLSPKQDKAQNESNFVTLSQISEQEKMEIIETGFRLNQ